MAGASSKERVHTYLVLKGAGASERIIVWDTQDVCVGRAPENDISIDDAVLSRKHLEFYRADGAHAVKDLGTSNGTAVNGETIRSHVLQNKDVVRIGEIEIQFVQVTKNPAQIGKKVEFASQLKNFGGAAGQAKDGEATMLGLMQPVDSEDEEEFVVGKVNDFAADLETMGMKEPAARAVPRDLDLELGGLSGDALPPPKPRGAAAKAAPVAKPKLAPPQEPEVVEDWPLDEVAAPAQAPRPAAKAAPVARPAAPAAAPRAAAPAAAARSVSLHVEIEGLSGELQRVVEALLGKVVELPPLRIRVKPDDLG